MLFRSGLYEQAREEFDAGEVAGSLGERFVRYSNAAALARAARSEPGYEDELESGSSLASLGSLIERAETDKINVISEKENLKLLGKLPPYKAGDAIDEAISSIVAKARLK